MLDAVTAYNQLRASERMGVQGTALWRMGSSDSSIWPIWDATRADDATRQKIKDIPPGPDLTLEGSGDIWHFADTPNPAAELSPTKRPLTSSPTKPTKNTRCPMT